MRLDKMKGDYKIEENIGVRNTGIYGKTLAAKKAFKIGELVFVAFGPIITKPTIYTIPISRELFIDPTKPEGNLCQFICHSCDPNLGIKDRNCFLAFKDIEAGDDVAIDYAMIVPQYKSEMTEENRKCKCGSSICRGKLGCFNELTPELKEKYKGYVSDYLLETES